jgi:hypothetical protein
MPADPQAWAEGSKIAAKNMDQIHKMSKGPAGMIGGGGGGTIGSKKKGGKIKRTGRYKLHKGEEEVVGKKVVGKVKKTGPRKLVKGEKIIPANKVAAKKKTRRKRG